MAVDAAPEADGRRVTRRLVAYLSGFDPQGPAHYHQLYRSEAAQQAAVAGYAITVGPRGKRGPQIARWEIEAEFDGQPVQTRYEFLRWDDIVRQHWPRGRLGLLSRTLWASWQMWRNGVMWHSWQSSWPMFVAIALPGLAVLVFAGLALILAISCGWLIHLRAYGVGLAVLTLGGPALWWAAVRVESGTHMAWLMRSLACLVRQGRGEMSDLETRLDQFAAHLVDQARHASYDEVLVVGHSSGAMLAMSVMARARKLMANATGGLSDAHVADPSAERDDGRAPPCWGLLTLGHCTPLLSAQPEAAAFRAELQALVDDRALCWVDYGAPADGCCFPMVDPSKTSGVTGPAANRPKLLNPRFAQLFDAQAYAHLRADKFRCHFQYLKAAQLPPSSSGSYDFFAMTAGSLSLAGRHAGLASQTDFVQFQCWGGSGG